MSFISAINGFEGRVELTGSRAIAGLFQSWNLRREGSGEWAWSLHAVLSFQKDSMLKHPKFKRRVLVKEHTSGVWYEVKIKDGGEPVLDGNQLTISGGQLCRTDQTGRP